MHILCKQTVIILFIGIILIPIEFSNSISILNNSNLYTESYFFCIYFINMINPDNLNRHKYQQTKWL